MRRASSLDEYVAKPFGRWFAGDTFVHFFADEELCGTVFFDRPDARDIETLTRAIAVELPGRSPIHRAFVDATRLTSIDPAAFRALADFVGPLAHELGRNVSRQAIVPPQGTAGLLVAGFYDVTPSSSPERTRIFDDRIPALAWLEVARPRALLEDIDRAREEASGASPELRAVRAALAPMLRDVTVSSIAAALGLTPRTLQQHLRNEGTSFRRELHAARIRAAKELLATSDMKVAAVALAVGCATVQHFTTLFRANVGQSPSAWRALHRRDDAGDTRSVARARARGTSR